MLERMHQVDLESTKTLFSISNAFLPSLGLRGLSQTPPAPPAHPFHPLHPIHTGPGGGSWREGGDIAGQPRAHAAHGGHQVNVCVCLSLFSGGEGDVHREGRPEPRGYQNSAVCVLW